MYTQKMIAEELGVSIGTVSLALRDSPLLKDTTKKLIKEFALKVNYQPSNIGRALQSGRSHLIGCLLFSVMDSFFNELLDGMTQTVTQNGYALLTSLPSSHEQVMEQINRMLVHHIDGLILCLHGHNPNLYPAMEQLSASGTPVIFCSTHDHGNLPVVVTDDFKGSTLAIQHLLSTGHKHVIIPNNLTIPSRLEGAVTTAQKNKLQYTLMDNVKNVVSIVKETNADSLFMFSDSQAIQAMRLLKNAGLRIPEDISVIGYDDIPVASYPEFNLTTIAQQRRELGIKAADFIIKSAEKQCPTHTQYLEPFLIQRETVMNRK